MDAPTEGTPFIHHPNMLDDDPKKNGLLCFVDGNRQCGPDCMAFQEAPPEGPDYRDQQWAQCMLLVTAHRSAKHLTILAQGISEMRQRAKVQDADQARTSQTPPPPAR